MKFVRSMRRIAMVSRQNKLIVLKIALACIYLAHCIVLILVIAVASCVLFVLSFFFVVIL